MSGFLKRGIMALFILTIGGLLLWHSHVWVQRQLDRHTPVIDVKGPIEVSGLPLLSVFPKRRCLLWLPGFATLTEHRMTHRFPGLWHARVIGHFFENRIEVHVQARVPLVQCNGQYMDGEGVLFSLSQPPSTVLPQIIFAHPEPAKKVGPWLLSLSRISWLWNDLALLKENTEGSWTIVLQSGPILQWGLADENNPLKAETLQKVMTRAAADHGGVLRADLRFFREGRIIVGVRAH